MKRLPGPGVVASSPSTAHGERRTAYGRMLLLPPRSLLRSDPFPCTPSSTEMHRPDRCWDRRGDDGEDEHIYFRRLTDLALTTGRKKGLRPASRCLWLHWQDAGGHYELRTPPHRFFSLESHFNLEKPNFVGFERQLVKLYSYLVNKNLYSYLTSRCLLYDMIDFVVIEA